MRLDVYLNYAGNCRQAFRLYEQHLGGKITMMMTHGQGPNATHSRSPFSSFLPQQSLCLLWIPGCGRVGER
jgi:uncharacterized glyoxalase superfamily protein PhnB